MIKSTKTKLLSKQKQLFKLLNDNYHDISISTSLSPVYTTDERSTINNTTSSSNSKAVSTTYNIRYVEMKDISQVDQCNRNNLPENYNVSWKVVDYDRWIVVDYDRWKVVDYDLWKVVDYDLLKVVDTVLG